LLYWLRQQRGRQAVSADPADQILHFGCLSYDGSDDPEQIKQAKALLKETPELASSSIHLAACAGDVDALRAWLERAPDSVNARGGIRDWEPLLYACYSRITLPQSDALGVVRLLLDHGADPNAHYLWGGQYRFTALTGVFGEGEGGPISLPEHPNWEPLAELIIAHGGQAEVLSEGDRFRFAVMNGDRDTALPMHAANSALAAELLRDQADLLHDAAGNNRLGAVAVLLDIGAASNCQTYCAPLHEAADSGHLEMAKLLIERGANPALRDVSYNGTAVGWARYNGNDDVADYIASFGLDIFAEIFLGNVDRVRSLLADDPNLAQLTFKSVRASDEADERDWRTPLVTALCCNQRECVQLLLAAGADAGIRTPEGQSLAEFASDAEPETLALLK
jgi:ankyrin repeat protein